MSLPPAPIIPSTFFVAQFYVAQERGSLSQISGFAGLGVNANLRFFIAALLAFEAYVAEERVPSDTTTLKQKHERVVGDMPAGATRQT
jgi:hypothetical protein